MTTDVNGRQGYGHGDVLLMPVSADARPANLTRTDRRVLAHGETGHAHALVEGSDIETWEDAQGVLWLRVGPRGGAITHEEHGVRPIRREDHDTEWLRVQRQQEYDHFAEEAREVRD